MSSPDVGSQTARASHFIPPPPPCPNGFLYTVQPGDTMFLIAQRFGVSLAALIAANPQVPNPNLIFPGQQLCVPVTPLAGPLMEFLTPTANSQVASGLARPGEPNPGGQFFIITIRVATSPAARILVKEGPSFAPALIGQPNPSFPDFRFFYSTVFITPGGQPFPPGTNLAALFQFAGSEVLPDGRIATTFEWFVGGSVPQTERLLTMSAEMRDVFGRPAFGEKFRSVRIIPGISGDSLTPNPPPPPPSDQS